MVEHKARPVALSATIIQQHAWSLYKIRNDAQNIVKVG